MFSYLRCNIFVILFQSYNTWYHKFFAALGFSIHYLLTDLTHSCTALWCLLRSESKSFIYSPFVLSKIRFCSCLVITLPARVFDSFMYSSLVCTKISLLREFFAALLASVFDSFIFSVCLIDTFAGEHISCFIAVIIMLMKK